MEAQKTLQEVSKSLGISTDKTRYWLSLLGMPQEKRGRVVFLPDETAAKLSELARLVSEGFQPGEAAKRARDSALMIPVNVTQSAATFDVAPFLGKMEAMEKAVMLLAESNKSIVEENRRLVEEIRFLRQDNEGIRKLLSPPVALSPAGSAPMVPAKKEPTFWAGFHQSVLEVQKWLRGVVAPFVEPFRGS